MSSQGNDESNSATNTNNAIEESPGIRVESGQLEKPPGRIDNETKEEKKNEEAKEESESNTLSEGSEETTLRVEAETRDGGVHDAPSNNEGRDAFSRYSNTNVRMMHLLQLDNGEDEGNEDNTDWQELTGYQGLRRLREGVDEADNTRRTRLSTELHPSAFSAFFFGQVFGNEHD